MLHSPESPDEEKYQCFTYEEEKSTMSEWHSQGRVRGQAQKGERDMGVCVCPWPSKRIYERSSQARYWVKLALCTRGDRSDRGSLALGEHRYWGERR